MTKKNLTIDPSIIKKFMQNYSDYMDSFGETTKYTPYQQNKSNDVGMKLFDTYSPEIQQKIRENRANWVWEIIRKNPKKITLNDKNHRIIKADDGTDVDLDDFLETTDYNDDNSQYVNGLMYKLYPKNIIGNYKKDKNGNVVYNENGEPVLADATHQIKIPTGDNIFFHQLTAKRLKNANENIPDEWAFLYKVGLKDYHDNPKYEWTRHSVENGPVYYNFYEPDSNGFSKNAITLVYDPKEKTWQQYSNMQNSLGQYISKVRDIDEKTKDVTNWKYRNETNRNGHAPIMMGTGEGFKFSNQIAKDAGWNVNALGGRTSRLYATGGTMGDIPLGEQQNDYNMINEGGTHEENPMGGVPYGVNQDGSQNMVEEGEVTVGDNVYSDRVELSSDLCQQLGLPQGTTPAQAMQQIEQLYEQGQLQDEEYQEISDIIFQDQENQKQGGEQGAPPERMEQPPAEGLDPSQLQGGAMPPEMMQGAPMPPEAMQGAMPPTQGAPMPPQEGITPDMVQGGSYAYGGYMRRRF